MSKSRTREDRVRFWNAVRTGVMVEEASRLSGVSAVAGIDIARCRHGGISAS